MRIAPLAVLLALLPAAPAAADTFAVDNPGDADLSASTAAPDDCTLRGAVNKANATTDPDVVTIPILRISLAGPLPTAGTSPLTIRGAGARSSIIDGTGKVGSLV